MDARRLARLAPGAVAAAVLLATTAVWTASIHYVDLTSWRRLWEDLADATNSYLDAAYGPSRRAPAAASEDTVTAYRQVFLEKIAELKLSPSQPWRALRARPFLPHRAPMGWRSHDDGGRARLLAWGFRLRGGIAPFLILWLGALFAVPVLLWTSWEFGEAGHGLAGGVYLLLVASSPFVMEALALPRAAVGFYVLAVLALVPLAVYAVLAPAPSRRGFAWRAALAAAAFTLCACCRGGTLLLFPGYALALVLAFERTRPAALPPPAPWRRGAAAAALLGVFLLPFALLRPPGHHDIWAAVWEGLGDFDREKGHTWSDPVAEEAVRAAGAQGLRNDEGQRVLRELVFRDVREDPGWYATILAKRVAASLTLWKLWPWSPRDGIHLRRATAPNEGFTDKYWGYATTVDCFGWGPAVKEAPISALLLPPLALMGWAAWRRRGAWGPVAVAGVVLLAVLALPVLISTAGGLETQCLAVPYLAAAAFLVEEIARAVRSLTHKPVPRKEAA
jgi:hypothetical protein